MTTLEETICDGQTYVFNANVYFAAGTYLDTLMNVNGLDSIITLLLTVTPPIEENFSVTICEGESYIVDGIEATTSGSYISSFANEDGCTTIENTELTVIPNAESNLDLSICQNDAIVINNTVYDINNPNGIETLLGASSMGCDSIINIDLQIESNIETNISESICEGEIFNIGNENFTESGDYSITLAGSTCDSIINLSLSVLPSITTMVTTTECQGDSFFIADTELTETGVYTFNLTSVNGWDSLFIVDITFSATSSSILLDTICPGESYTFGDTLLTESGEYQSLHTSAIGCDSTRTLILTVLDSNDPECAVSTYEIPDFNTTIFPNPFSDVITIHSEVELDEIAIYNTLGELVILKNGIQTSEVTIDGNLLTSGVYFMSITSNKGKVLQKIIRE